MKRPRWLSRLTILVASATVALGALPPAASSVADAAPAIGYDVSWPQCGQPLPAQPAFGIVGVNDGHPYSDNPCLAGEYRWAAAAGRPGFYLNTANPGPGASIIDWYGQTYPNAACRRGNEAVCAYDYGYRGAAAGFRYALAQVSAGAGHTWWLDVETANIWSATDRASNLASIAGAIDFLRAQGVVVGVYSTRYQWGRITGGASRPDLVNWVPGAGSRAAAAARCSAGYSFSGGPVMVTQFVSENADVDYDYPCPGSDAILRPSGPPGGGLGGLLNGVLSLLGLAPPSANG
jgi:hypothetical protein